METTTIPETFTIERRLAANILGISERSLDRYIRKGLLHSQFDGKRVLLDQKELEKFKSKHIQKVKETEVFTEIPTEAVIDSPKKKKRKKEIASEDRETEDIQDMPGAQSAGQILKELYQGLKKELLAKQTQVEMLNFKIGELSYQLKQTVPLLEFQGRKKELEADKKVLEEKLIAHKSQLTQLEQFAKTEKFNRQILLALLIAILFIEPVIWLARILGF